MFPPRSLLPFLALLIVVAAPIGIRVIRGGATPDEFRMPPFDLHDLPLQIGQWRGQEMELDPKIFQVLDAKAAIDRVYRNLHNDAVTLHSAVFENSGHYVAPHTPDVCYRGAGYELLDEHTVSIQIDQNKSVSAGLFKFQRDGLVAHVLVWYQLGEQTYGTWTAAKAARRALWGQRVWPATVKVMLQDTDPDASAAEARMTNLAKEVYRWMNRTGRSRSEETSTQRIQQHVFIHNQTTENRCVQEPLASKRLS